MLQVFIKFRKLCKASERRISLEMRHPVFCQRRKNYSRFALVFAFSKFSFTFRILHFSNMPRALGNSAIFKPLIRKFKKSKPGHAYTQLFFDFCALVPIADDRAIENVREKRRSILGKSILLMLLKTKTIIASAYSR